MSPGSEYRFIQFGNISGIIEIIEHRIQTDFHELSAIMQYSRLHRTVGFFKKYMIVLI